MPMKGQFSRERNAKVTSGRDGRQRGNSQDHFVEVSKEKLAVVSGNIDAKFEDRIRVVKNDKFRRQREPRSADGGGSLKGSKPWPGRKDTTVDELVKHMSNVPSYLQRKETTDHLQDKALNVGVLEWGLLARWSHQHKQEFSSSHGASPSNTSRSVIFSSPSQSSASPSSKSLESNQSPTLNDHQRCSIEFQQSDLVDKLHGKARYSPSPNSAVLNLLPMHRKHCSENAGNYGDFNLRNASPISDSLTASGSSVRHEMVDDEETTKKIEEAVHHCSRRLFTDDDNIGQSFFTSYNNDSSCGGFQQTSGMTGEIFESLVSNAVMEMERNANMPSVGFSKDIEQSHEFPRVPYSCPLPIMDPAEELSTRGTGTRGDSVRADVTGENCNQKQISRGASERTPRISAKFSDMDVLSHSHLVSGLNRVGRCSSLKDGPYPRQPEAITPVDKMSGDKSSGNKGSRRSPLRRMLDPILKPRQSSTSGPIQPSFVPKCHLPGHIDKQSLNLGGSALQNVQRRSVDSAVNSNCRSETNTNQPPPILLNSGRYLQQDIDSTATRHALLQLAWKNGLPFFMLSCGSDILAATVRRKGISDNNDLESTYTLFGVEEPKKRGGAWIKAGNKNKKDQLLYNVVGEMRVSRRKTRCYQAEKNHAHREFVLVGSERLLSSEESGDSHVNRELAAFISAVPQQEAESSHQSSSQNSGRSISASVECSCRPLGNFHRNTRDASSALSSVLAVLPNGFHGTSTSGQPLPLIERWRSGGACDCGGWDEGCMLSVLSDDAQESKGGKSTQANQTTDGSQRFDLLVQGRSRENRHGFSMVSFREGLYTVEFRSSIALLQAFAMCIVMLHGRYPSRMQAGVQASQEHAPLADHKLNKIMAASHGRAQASYVPHRPPLSPVGRA
ncbi:uncharacterized protein LOC102704874 [Oryza brachyantha]|uniref:DUF3527 domain-containing protein n=1 Tax=Oryza brachyantha TaxID=4533 RepID=J3LMC3_ORYBR|nr:uncharacterized protein LOC102704874 [Oryza brachyantha]